MSCHVVKSLPQDGTSIKEKSYEQRPTKQGFPSDEAALLTQSGFKQVTFTYKFQYAYYKATL